MIIGMEGLLPLEKDVTWGAAALQVGDKLVNGVSGLYSDISEIDSLVESNVLTKLPHPIDAEGKWVLLVRNHHVFLYKLLELPHVKFEEYSAFYFESIPQLYAEMDAISFWIPGRRKI